jgi:hypothetical protein
MDRMQAGRSKAAIYVRVSTPTETLVPNLSQKVEGGARKVNNRAGNLAGFSSLGRFGSCRYRETLRPHAKISISTGKTRVAVGF